MKFNAFFAFVCLAFVSAEGRAQTLPGAAASRKSPGTRDASATISAASVPVGVLTQSLAPATGSNNPTCGTVSIPVYNSPLALGLITSVDNASAFSSSAAGWTVNAFTSTPCFARIKSGANVGRCFLITANTATQLTVVPQGTADTHPYDLTTLLSAGDAFEVFPANTLGSLFGITGGPFLTGKTASVADNVYLWNAANATWDVYFNNGSHWRSASSIQNQDGTILYPDEGLYIVHRDLVNPLKLTFLGTVPSTTERTDLPGPGSACVALRFPVDTSLGTLALQNMPNWLSGKTASKSDNVYVWNTAGNTWDVCFYNGTHWRSASSIQNVEDTEIVSTGTAIFLIRQSTADGLNSTFVQAVPYNLN